MKAYGIVGFGSPSATGHLGLTAAAITGEAVARGMLGEPPQLDLRPYSAERFDSGSGL